MKPVETLKEIPIQRHLEVPGCENLQEATALEIAKIIE